MDHMFNGDKTVIRTQMGHNCHENVGRRQQDGTSLLLYGALIGQYDSTSPGKDDTDLGRWVTITLRGNGVITTQMLCEYNP